MFQLLKQCVSQTKHASGPHPVSELPVTKLLWLGHIRFEEEKKAIHSQPWDLT